MKHIVLLGDSIFDNKAYVGNEPDVISQLQNKIPADWQATLNAIDGSVIENIGHQLLDVPQDTTHLFISVGGNDAILNADVLQLKINSSAEVFDILANRVSTFEYHYKEMLKKVLSLNLPTTLCTIYFPNSPDDFIQKISCAALASFNDVIVRQAFLNGLPLIDLRLVCNEKDDYANEIEPSSKGGNKISEKILEVVNTHNFSSKQTKVYF
jgi:GDSL-like Lipase/Acylhydrolase family